MNIDFIANCSIATLLAIVAWYWCTWSFMPVSQRLVVALGTWLFPMAIMLRGAPLIFPALVGGAWLIISHYVCNSWFGRSTQKPKPELVGLLFSIGWAMFGTIVLRPMPLNVLDLAWTITIAVAVIGTSWVWQFWWLKKKTKKKVKYTFK